MTNPRIPFWMLSERQPLKPPRKGRMLIVQCVMNVEYWPFDQPMPRKLIPGPHGNDKIPDVTNFSWVEYGMRTGFPRILEALKQRGIRQLDLGGVNTARSAGIARFKCRTQGGIAFANNNYICIVLHTISPRPVMRSRCFYFSRRPSFYNSHRRRDGAALDLSREIVADHLCAGRRSPAADCRRAICDKLICVWRYGFLSCIGRKSVAIPLKK